jgi:hypothetical protein
MIFLWKTAVFSEKPSSFYHSKDSVKSGDNKLRKSQGPLPWAGSQLIFTPG